MKVTSEWAEDKDAIKYDEVNGKIQYKEEKRILYDNCFQQVVPLEDFYPSTPMKLIYQKQPHVIWDESHPMMKLGVSSAITGIAICETRRLYNDCKSLQLFTETNFTLNSQRIR